MRREQMRLVDTYQHSVAPMFAGCREKARKEGRRFLDAMIGLQIGKVEMEGDTMLPRSQRERCETIIGIFACDDRRCADMRSKVGELAFRVDDDGGEIIEGFFDDPAQRVAFARARRSLNQTAPRHQLAEIQF